MVELLEFFLSHGYLTFDISLGMLHGQVFYQLRETVSQPRYQEIINLPQGMPFWSLFGRFAELLLPRLHSAKSLAHGLDQTWPVCLCCFYRQIHRHDGDRRRLLRPAGLTLVDCHRACFSLPSTLSSVSFLWRAWWWCVKFATNTLNAFVC